MIRGLRKRHFSTIVILCILVPLIFILAMSMRQTIPVTASFPLPLEPVPAPLTPTWQATASEETLTLALSTGMRDGAWYLDVQPENALAVPDVLVYYTDDPSNHLLEAAYLLGSMAGGTRRQFSLPLASIGKVGQLRFYSLAHQRLVLSQDLPATATQP